MNRTVRNWGLLEGVRGAFRRWQGTLVALGGAIGMAGCGSGSTTEPGFQPELIGTLEYWVSTPRIITPETGDTVELTLWVAGTVDAVTVDAAGETVPATFTGKIPSPTTLGPQLATWSARLSRQALVSAYEAVGGYTVEMHRPSGARDRSFALLFVWNQAVPPIMARQLAPDVQVGPHVVNVRIDDPDLAFTSGVFPAAEIAQRFYDSYPDDFLFLFHIPAVEAPSGGNAGVILFNEPGLGRAPVDHTVRSAFDVGQNELRALISMRNALYFDFAGEIFLHEFAHLWMVGPDLIPGGSAGGHWPVSEELGRGFLGVVMGTDGSSGFFPFRLVEQVDGTVMLRSDPLPGRYTPMELYGMGLLSADSVPAFRVFPSRPRPSNLVEGMIFREAMDTITIEEVIAHAGQRPPRPNRTVRGTGLVTSYRRLLTPDELAYFDLMVARGEALEAVPAWSGNRPLAPFFVATGGRGRLETTLPPPFAGSPGSTFR